MTDGAYDIYIAECERRGIPPALEPPIGYRGRKVIKSAYHNPPFDSASDDTLFVLSKAQIIELAKAINRYGVVI